MHINKVSFQNFRNFGRLELKFNPGFIVLAGPNGMGKTNFLEGLYWGAVLRRFPGTKLGQLMRDNELFYKINLQFHSKDEEILEIVSEREGEKYSAQGRPASGWKFTYRYNNLAVPRAKFAGHLPVISFLPEDLNLLGHSPAGRRRYLNETLSTTSAEYRRNLSEYEKTLKQRNELLQNLESESNSGQDEIWNERLAEYGSLIIAERQKFLEFVKERFEAATTALSPELTGSMIDYRFSGSPDRQGFLAEISGLGAREKEAHGTLIGPHKDDFRLSWLDREVIGYVSRGQLRSYTLALKILAREYIKDKLSAQPVMLLDDVFSEFDEAHQRALIDFLQTFDQVFLTTAHLKEVQPFLPVNSQVYNVNDGTIIPSPFPHFPPLEGEGLREG